MPGYQHSMLCSECGIVGGTDSSAECPNCGSKSLNRPRQAPPRPRTLHPKFQTASRLRLDALTIDIGERVCLIGKCSTLVDGLCITALLPERHGGFGSPHVVIIDAGNSSDIYSCVILHVKERIRI